MLADPVRLDDGRRSGGSFRYIVDRTLHRPREMILFSAQCLHTAALRGSALPMDQTTITTAELSRLAAAPTTSRPSSGSSTRTCSAFEAGPRMLGHVERADLEFVALEVLAGDLVVGPRARRWLAEHDEDALIEVCGAPASSRRR